jgi:hypothetical protein
MEIGLVLLRLTAGLTLAAHGAQKFVWLVRWARPRRHRSVLQDDRT